MGSTLAFRSRFESIRHKSSENSYVKKKILVESRPMYTLKHFSIALIASIVFIVAPVLGCCSATPMPSNTGQSLLTPVIDLSASEHHLVTNDTQMPCHDMATNAEIDLPLQDEPSHDSGHCDSCANCVTTMARETAPVLVSSLLDDTDFEALYFFVLLDFSAFQRKALFSERPPDNPPILAFTPITLHQILTI